jgi:serine/threonine protein kinase
MVVKMDFPHIPAGVTVGPFRIEKLLSKDGNMSRVFVASTESGRPVALKIARSDNPIFTNFIKDEVAQLSKIRHPNVVHLYPIPLGANKVVYIAKGVSLSHLFEGVAPWYYAMEMINGGSMYAYSDALVRYPIEWRIELLYQIALTIHYLHRKGIAHRDLKPDNLVFRTPLNRNGGQLMRPDPVLVDFGIAARHNEDPQLFTGTLRYAAPEVVERLTGMRAHYRTTMTAQADHLAADVWSFGVIAYELLTGTHPFAPYKTDEQLAEKILHSVPTVARGVPDEIFRILLGDPRNRDNFGGLKGGMLSKVRDDRPDIEQVIQLLDTETPYLPPRY